MDNSTKKKQYIQFITKNLFINTIRDSLSHYRKNNNTDFRGLTNKREREIIYAKTKSADVIPEALYSITFVSKF